MKNLLTVLFVTLYASQLIAQNERPVPVSLPDTVIMSTLPVDIQVDGEGSIDPDGSITKYVWLIGRDTVLEGKSGTITINDKRTAVSLLVEDDDKSRVRETFTVFVGHPTNNGLNRVKFRNDLNPIFVSGMNIAWYDFANDLDVYSETSMNYFKEVMDSVKLNGGNSLRWWLHTNGANSPIVNTDGEVVGIDFEEIRNMKRILDMAYERDMAISMCLWSFDMLQLGQSQSPEAMQNLLEDSSNIQSYIDKALLPILDLLGSHPAVLCWEIFNEPEGMTNQFGWSTAGRVNMSDIQRFVNMCAGAIHRKSDDFIVSNGSWSFLANSDLGARTNYYSDEALIEAGGDELGVLDFYQVHYYPEHSNNDLSPFHRPADFWELDKPIVIGEFPADTIDQLANPHISIEKAYELLLEYGYAGAMSWAWNETATFNKNFQEHTRKGLRKVSALAADDINFSNENLTLDQVPVVAAPIDHVRLVIEDDLASTTEIDLNNVFKDEGESDSLSFELVEQGVANGVSAELVGGKLIYTVSEPSFGTRDITITATDKAGWFATDDFLVVIGSIVGNENNLAFFKPIKSSSEITRANTLAINDGDRGTRWNSGKTPTLGPSDQTVIIDLEEVKQFNFIDLQWGFTATDTYEIETSLDNKSWKAIVQRTSGVANRNLFGFDEIFEARYVRLSMHNRDRYSISELTMAYIPDNQAPESLTPQKDIKLALATAPKKLVLSSIASLITDKEQPELLRYQVTSSDDSFVKGRISSGMLEIEFEELVLGSAEISIRAEDPFGSSVSTSFNVSILDEVLSITKSIDNELKLYPTFVKSELTVDSKSSQTKEAVLINSRGDLVKHLQLNPGLNMINVDDLSQGVYLVKVLNQNSIQVKKFVKTN